MDKKVLVIEDWGKVKTEIGLAIRSAPPTTLEESATAHIISILSAYEQDMIGFEAEVITVPFHTGHIIEGRSWLDAIMIPVEVMKQLELRGGGKVQVFVLKPKKPEVENEKDKT